MRSPTLKFQEMLRRLGVHGGGEGMEIIQSVQPTMDVGGALSDLVPLIAPPTTLVGGQVTGGGTGATTAACRVEAGAGSGVALEISVSSNLSGDGRWAVSTVPGLFTPFTTTVTPVPQPIGGPEGTIGASAVMLLGTALKGDIGLTRPGLRWSANSAHIIDIFIPAGQVFEIAAATNASVLACFATMVELTQA